MNPTKHITKILFVCTGNVCRSPAAEAMLRHKVGEQGFGSSVFIDSAGTTDQHVGEAPTNLSVLEGGRRGYDLATLTARQICQDDFDRFDQIICMTSEHKKKLEQSFSSGVAKLTLFGAVAPDVLAADIPDPWGEDAASYARMYDVLEIGTSKLAIQLRQECAGCS